MPDSKDHFHPCVSKALCTDGHACCSAWRRSFGKIKRTRDIVHGLTGVALAMDCDKHG